MQIWELLRKKNVAWQYLPGLEDCHQWYDRKKCCGEGLSLYKDKSFETTFHNLMKTQHMETVQYNTPIFGLMMIQTYKSFVNRHANFLTNIPEEEQRGAATDGMIVLCSSNQNTYTVSCSFLQDMLVH